MIITLHQTIKTRIQIDSADLADTLGVDEDTLTAHGPHYLASLVYDADRSDLFEGGDVYADSIKVNKF